MPLETGKSEAAFKHNVEAEVAAGKPQKQAVAIAYSEQRAADSAPHAAGIMHSCGDKILLLRRSMDSVHGGTWAFPGGHVEDGEDPYNAACREFNEETGTLAQNVTNSGKQYDGFMLYRAQGDSEFKPTLNTEHIDYMWADRDNLPEPLHPGVREQIFNPSSDAMDGARQEDENGFITIEANPISRSGVFPYSGRSLPGGDPEKIYNVYRPEEELNNPDTLKSFQLLPIINDHEMLGKRYEDEVTKKERHGTTGETIFFQNGVLFSTIRIFSNALKSLIDSGKTALSAGYKCTYEKIAGEFNGIRYDYIQRNIRGNHLALVNEARCDVAVLDHHWAFDSFDLALDKKGTDMAEEKKEMEKKEAKDNGAGTGEEKEEAEVSLEHVHKYMKKNAPKWHELQKMMAGEDEDEMEETETLDEEKKGDVDIKGEDEDEEEKKEKKDAMDSIDRRLARLEVRVTEKTMKEQIAATAKLAGRLTKAVGTFDYSAMDEADVVKYGVEKLGITAGKGQERAALEGYLSAVEKNSNVGFGMDSTFVKPKKSGGLLNNRFINAQA